MGHKPIEGSNPSLSAIQICPLVRAYLYGGVELADENPSVRRGTHSVPRTPARSGAGPAGVSGAAANHPSLSANDRFNAAQNQRIVRLDVTLPTSEHRLARVEAEQA